MTPEQFCYWLQGFAELNPSVTPDDEQWHMIQEHLNTVFNKMTSNTKKVEPLVKRRVLTEAEKKTRDDADKGDPDARKRFQDLLDELHSDRKVNPYDRPDVYCKPDMSGKRIC